MPRRRGPTYIGVGSVAEYERFEVATRRALAGFSFGDMGRSRSRRGEYVHTHVYCVRRTHPAARDAAVDAAQPIAGEKLVSTAVCRTSRRGTQVACRPAPADRVGCVERAARVHADRGAREP